MTNNNSSDKINTIEDKIGSFSEILQNFGLNLIQNIGKITHSIHILTDKIDELFKTTLDIKGLIPQLNKIIEKQDIIESEIDLLKSVISQGIITQKSTEIERDETTTIKSNNAKEIFNNLKKALRSTKDLEKIKALLDETKESIFEITGGHRTLYEISKTITELKNFKEFNESLEKMLLDKIDFWIIKF